MTKPGFVRQSVAGSYVVKPRIMGVDLKRRCFEGRETTAWYEWRYKDKCFIEPAIITGDNTLLTQDMIADASVIDWENYGVNWRLWTHRPTEELRREVAWGA